MRVSQVSTPGGAALSEWLPLDAYPSSGAADGLFAEVSGTVAYSLEVTPDNIFDPTAKAAAIAFALAAPFAVGTTVNASGVLPYAAKAVRINQASGAGTVTLKVVTRGIN